MTPKHGILAFRTPFIHTQDTSSQKGVKLEESFTGSFERDARESPKKPDTQVLFQKGLISHKTTRPDLVNINIIVHNDLHKTLPEQDVIGLSRKPKEKQVNKSDFPCQ